MKVKHIIYIWVSVLIFFLFGIFLIGLPHRFALSEDEARFWDLALKGLGGIVAVSGASIAIVKYLYEQEKANEAALREANKPFFTKRQEVYYDLVTATAILSTEDHTDDEWIRSESIFWKLFWGALPLVTDDLVGAATNKFQDVWLDELMEEEQKYIAMRNASMQLAKACRASLGFA